MSRKKLMTVMLHLPLDGWLKIPNDQYYNCRENCERSICPPEAIMAANMNIKEFTCDLWREK